MRKLYQAAIIAFGVGGALAAVPASAQPYGPGGGRPGVGGENYSDYYQQNNPAYGDQGYGDPGYDQGYGDPGYAQQYGAPGYDQGYGDPYAGGYGADSYGCDPTYGCPQDYADLPLYDGEVYYDGGWSNGPFYYRDFGGGRQFWIHGGWHGGNYRGGHFGARGGYRGGFAFHRGYRDYNSGTRGGFSGRSFYRPNYTAQQRQSVRQFSRPNGFGGGFGGRSSFQGGGHSWGGGNHSWNGGGHSWSGGHSGGGSHTWNGGGGSHNWSGHHH